MKSSSGEHFVGLDHIRGMAAFLVVAWHFNHGYEGSPLPTGSPPVVFPFSIIDQGHTGVALFMVLSGYLFTRLLAGKEIDFGAFLWNRLIRLLPLLVVSWILTIAYALWKHENLEPIFNGILWGWLLPHLPRGGFSITAEFHFYLLLPLLLWAFLRSAYLPLIFIGAMLLLRVAIYALTDEAKSISYYTIIGRADQFILGMVAFHLKDKVRGKHLMLAGIGLLFSAFYYWLGSKDIMNEHHDPAWIYIPTIEGLVYAAFVAWYDSSFTFRDTLISRFMVLAGTYSYSIYLLHFYFVFIIPRLISQKTHITSFYAWTALSMVFFLFMMGVGYLSFRFIESPFLRFRKRYTRTAVAIDGPVRAA